MATPGFKTLSLSSGGGVTRVYDIAGDGSAGFSPSVAVEIGGSSGGGGAATVADGADVTQGAIADATVAAGAAGSISAKLRRATQGLEDLKSLISLAAGVNTIGGVHFPDALDPGNDALRAFQVVGRMYDTATPPNQLTVKRKRVTVTATSATSIVPAVTGKQIQTLGYTLQSQGGNTPSFNFQDDAGSPVVLSRTWKLDATGVAGVNSVLHTPSQLGCGVDPTTVTQALMGKMDATGSVVVEVTYVEV